MPIMLYEYNTHGLLILSVSFYVSALFNENLSRAKFKNRHFLHKILEDDWNIWNKAYEREREIEYTRIREI